MYSALIVGAIPMNWTNVLHPSILPEQENPVGGELALSRVGIWESVGAWAGKRLRGWEGRSMGLPGGDKPTPLRNLLLRGGQAPTRSANPKNE
jgi:hypothetical protein